MERLNPNHTAWAPLAAIAAVGALLLLNGCANDGRMVEVGAVTGGGQIPNENFPTPTPTVDPDTTATPNPTPTDGPDNTPTPAPTASPTATPDPDESPTPTPAPTPSLACGTVVIRDVRLSGDAGESHFRPWADLDIANPNGSTINGFGIPEGTYDRVRFTMHKRTGSDSNGPGTGNPEVNHSIHICGTWQGVQFDYTDDTTDNVDRRDPAGVTVDLDGPGKLFVVFDSSTWFDGIDLTQATVAADGIVYLAHHENEELQRQFRDNFKASVKLANDLHR